MSGPIKLGDVEDLDGYTAATFHRIRADASPQEVAEALADGREIAAVEFGRLEAGERLSERLGRVLGNRLRDRWRERHPEHRRNVRAGTARTVEVEDHPPDGFDVLLDPRDQERLIESRMALEAIGGEADLRSPNLIGRLFFGVPSHRPVGTVAAREIWATIEAERELTEPPD